MRLLKKILAVSLTGILMVSLLGMAKEPTAAPSANAVSYVSEEKAVEIAKKKIALRRSVDPACTWDETTKIDSTVKLFDYDGSANYYLFRLATDVKPVGYILVDALTETAGVQMTGYEAEAPVDVMFQNANHRLPTTEDHLICAGAFDYAQQTPDGKLKSVETQKVLSASKQELKQNYQKSVLRAKKSVQLQQASTVTQQSRAYQPHICRLPNLSGWRPYIMSDFDKRDTRNCTPTAATTFVNYWATRHPNKKPGLWTGYPYNALKGYLGYTRGLGTASDVAIPALTRYGAEYANLPITGDDHRWNSNIDWAFITKSLLSDLPLMINLTNEPKYNGNHTVVALGYADDGPSCYLYLADGWTTDTYTTYRYEYNTTITFAGYVRWN